VMDFLGVLVVRSGNKAPSPSSSGGHCDFPSLNAPKTTIHPYSSGLIVRRDLASVKLLTLKPGNVVAAGARYKSPFPGSEIRSIVGRAWGCQNYISAVKGVVRREPWRARRETVIGVSSAWRKIVSSAGKHGDGPAAGEEEEELYKPTDFASGRLLGTNDWAREMKKGRVENAHQ
jgi:hypothetical protein